MWIDRHTDDHFTAMKFECATGGDKCYTACSEMRPKFALRDEVVLLGLGGIQLEGEEIAPKVVE